MNLEVRIVKLKQFKSEKSVERFEPLEMFTLMFCTGKKAQINVSIE